ncbi:MAG: universal stress protein [Candidatus Binatia bacterium]|nr:universal stress protein [Candidatus Binatia bacterium]
MATSDRKVKAGKKLHSLNAGGPKRILAATDFSSIGNRAVAYAMSLSEVLNAQVVVVHVVQPVLQVEGLDAAALAKEGEAWAKRQVQKLGSQPAAVVITHGSPVDSILREAKKHRADLVVVGSRGLSGWKKWILGSVAQRLLQMAHCPVLVVPKQARLPKK